MRTNIWICGTVLGTLTSCGAPAVQLDETTVVGHQQQATKERAEAKEDRAQFDPAAEHEQSSAMAGRAGAESVEGVLMTVNPTAHHLADAQAHARHAKEHESAAAKLATFEDDACKTISEGERASCPTLLSDSLTPLPNGIRLRTGAKRLPAVLANMRCTLAFAHARGYGEESLCPLAMKGVVANAAPDGTGVDLTATDHAAVEALHALIQQPHRGM